MFELIALQTDVIKILVFTLLLVIYLFYSLANTFHIILKKLINH